jgi:signal transduction histidine kinase
MLLTRATVARPANAIAAGAERITNGELSTTVPEQGADELVRLARAFNAMTLSLREARALADQEAARRIEEEAGRVAAERKLQHARALAAVGQVAASIGHEIGSPLGVILGRARLLAQSECPDPMKRDLTTIAEQSERISRVVARLLSVARAPRVSGQTASVVRVVADVLQFLGPECRQRRVEARVDCDEPSLLVALDADQLFQVLFNLCWNAIEAQPGGGDLLIRVRANTKGAGAMARVTIDVVDRGPGVPPDLASRIFDPFFTTKSDRAGTGLGLDIVSGIAREAGGSVELAPTEAPGACFRVTLPAARSPGAAVEIRELGS